ncbi:MAG: amidohydrolase family protein [Acidobacteriota bacterium]|nr:amidohydrolase family protein [Acidobacteriota bacterium]
MDHIREGKLGLLVPQIEMDQAERYRDSYDPKRLRQLNALFVKHQTWQCPTLIGPEATGLAADSMANDFAGYPYLRYVPQASQDSWKRLLSTRFSPEQIPNLRVYFAYKRVLTAAMHRAGVKFLSGTDVQGGTTYLPGFSLHDELAIFVQVGFSPLEALQTATINPAHFLGREKELGTVERGKLADLVLLDANPLDNIGNTRGISGVIVNGAYLEKEALQRMLAEVESATSKK